MKKLIILFILGVCITTGSSQGNDNVVNYPVYLNISENLGSATAFQSKDDPNGWYLLPNSLTIKRNQQGRPMFGFIKYVRNKRSGAMEDEIDQGMGGGVVYFTAGFEINAEQQKELLRELKRRKGSNARILGSIAYDSGDIEVVTFGIENRDENKTEVLGVGTAPLMDGDAIAVNIILNGENATKLWETFDEGKGNYGNLGLNLNMQIRGYHTPVSAKISMKTEDIMNNERISAGVNAGMSNSTMGVVMGAEMEKLTNELINSGAIKIEQVGDIGSDFQEILSSAQELFMKNFMQPVSLQELNSINSTQGGSRSPLERATNLRNNQLEQAQGRSDARRKEKIQILSINDVFSSTSETETPRSSPPPPPPSSESERSAEIARIQAGGSNTADKGASNPNARSAISPTQGNSESVNSSEALQDELDNDPMNIGVSAYMGYFVRNDVKKQSYEVDLSKIRAVQRGRTISSSFPALPPDAFLQVNLDDPLYKQREVVAMIDGFNAKDFGSFVNYVTITMKKKHQGGDITTDEVRIDRKNFNSEGNRFKLLYGWGQGDNDRRNWLNYDYKVDWSFFGGGEVSEDWVSTSRGAINVAPPYQKYTLSLSGDEELLKEENVRLVTVKLYYDVNGKELTKMHTFNVRKKQLEADIDLLLSPELKYQYEIIWQLKGNKLIETGRQNGGSLYLLIDEIPS